MASTTDLSRQLFLALSDISHPLEGTFYLFLLAVIFRWGWPSAWNNFLKSIESPVEESLKKESKSKSEQASRLHKNNNPN